MVISCSKYFVQVKRYNGSDWRSIFYISILLSTSDYKLIINKIYETTLKIKNKSPSFKKSRNKFSKILINHAIYFCDIKRRERSSIKLPATHKPNQSPNLKSQNQFLNIPGHPSNQPSLFLSLINPILSNNIPFFFYEINHPPRPYPKPLPNPKRQLFSRDHPIVQPSLSEKHCEKNKNGGRNLGRGWMEDSSRRSSGRFFSPGFSDGRADYENRGRRGRVETRP